MERGERSGEKGTGRKEWGAGFFMGGQNMI